MTPIISCNHFSCLISSLLMLLIITFLSEVHVVLPNNSFKKFLDKDDHAFTIYENKWKSVSETHSILSEK